MCRKSLFALILLAGGCGAKSYNVASPVLGPAPPRIKDAMALQQQSDGNSIAGNPLKMTAADGVRVVSHEEQMPLDMGTVVATVNGRPILAGEILEQYIGKLKEFEHQLAAAVNQGVISDAQRNQKIRETQEMLLKRDIDRFVEQILMADAVRSRLKKDQLDDVNAQLAEYFEKEVVANLKTKMNAASAIELEIALQEQGMSLETMRKMFADQQLASQYVRTKMGEDPRPSRAELLAVYNSQIANYSRPMQVKWQQLQINIASPDSKSKALLRMEEVQASLNAGMSFDDAVKKFCEGPLKENGGHWDWTQPESVANPEVREALKKLKSGQVSAVLTSPTNLQIVKVTARREPGNQPLEEVQEDIRQQIISEFRERRAIEVVKEIREKAIIDTLFDDESEIKENSTENTVAR